ncbi:hypothetical protein HU200_003916 [Digitaria exilis]|uniref:Uncharacterized protein n=1 Tax=Digitaria exilis TaxID=1010633 RepID=A0A835FVX8_9POAL|nr:hypothetical protein HU200_003916 [Digitaria exilis]
MAPWLIRAVGIRIRKQRTVRDALTEPSMVRDILGPHCSSYS